MRLGLLIVILFALLGFAAKEILQKPSNENDEALQALFQAYGGKEALAGIQTYESWSEHFRTGSGQGYKPGPSLEGYDRHIYGIDFTNRRAGHEVWSLYTGSYFHLNNTTAPDAGHEVDYRREIIKTSPPQGMQFVLQRAQRENPLLLIREIALNPDAATEITPSENDRPLALDFTLQGVKGTLYLNAGTFLVESAQFQGGEETYAYRDYEALENGMPFPKRIDIKDSFIVDGKATNLKVQINIPVDQLFIFEKPLRESGSLDQSRMTARQLGEGIYHVGAFGNYSLFVDQGDYLVAIGGGQGIAQRLAFLQAMNTPKPLKFLVTTHHHSDHINFLSELAETDTQFISVDSNFTLFRDVFPGNLDPGRLVAVDGELALEAEEAPAVQIFETASPHAYRQLMVYVPAARAVFVADVFEETSPYPSLQPATRNVLSVKDTIEELGLEVEIIITAHSPRILDIDELYQAANRPVPENMCFEGRPICNHPVWSDVDPF